MSVKGFTLGDYLKAIGQYPLLTAQEEHELALRMRDGDEDARQKLITHNLRFVVRIAKSYKSKFLTIEDMIQEGNIGLIENTAKFDPDRNLRFTTFIAPWIKNAIMKAITSQGRAIRLPAHIYSELKQMNEAIDVLLSEGNEFPNEVQIAQKMNVEPERVQKLLNWRQSLVSLSTPLGDDSEDTLEDLQSGDDESPVEYAERQEGKELITKMFASLPNRTQIIMKMRYGLGAPTDPADWQNEHTLEEIGDYLGITRERVRQIEKDTLQSLKLKFGK